MVCSQRDRSEADEGRDGSARSGGRLHRVRRRGLPGFVWVGLATMPGLPATVIPASRTAEGLPVGVQLIGPIFEDRTVLRLAELLEQ